MSGRLKAIRVRSLITAVLMAAATGTGHVSVHQRVFCQRTIMPRMGYALVSRVSD